MIDRLEHNFISDPLVTDFTNQQVPMYMRHGNGDKMHYQVIENFADHAAHAYNEVNMKFNGLPHPVKYEYFPYNIHKRSKLDPTSEYTSECCVEYP